MAALKTAASSGFSVRCRKNGAECTRSNAACPVRMLSSSQPTGSQMKRAPSIIAKGRIDSAWSARSASLNGVWQYRPEVSSAKIPRLVSARRKRASDVPFMRVASDSSTTVFGPAATRSARPNLAATWIAYTATPPGQSSCIRCIDGDAFLCGVSSAPMTGASNPSTLRYATAGAGLGKNGLPPANGRLHGADRGPGGSG
jgi:hypothetical protein